MPSGLCRMEITETSYAAIEADRNATLEALREAGILLLLDDFGSGYSSFGMLQNYNFDIMKIDMSFVRQIETNTKTRSIIRFIIEMAHTMEIKIIAEGAETKEQVEFLRDNGCDYIQGYYFYKPNAGERVCETVGCRQIAVTYNSLAQTAQIALHGVSESCFCCRQYRNCVL